MFICDFHLGNLNQIKTKSNQRALVTNNVIEPQNNSYFNFRDFYRF